MPSLEELLAASLMQERERMTAQNPFSIASKAISGLDVSGAVSSPKDAWKAALLQSLASGFTGGLGEQQVESEYGNLASRLSKAYESPDVAEALRADQGLEQFSGLANLIQNQRQADIGSKIQELQNRMKYEVETQKQLQPLELQKIEAQRRAQDITPQNPLSKQAIERLMLGEDISQEEARALSNENIRIQSLATSLKQQTGVQERFENASLPQKTQDVVQGALDIDEKMAPLLAIADKLDKDPASRGIQFTRDAFLSAIPIADRQRLQEWLGFGGLDVAISMQGRNTSDKDAKIVLDFFSGQGAGATPGELRKRFQYFIDKSKYSAKNALDLAGKQRKYAQSAKEVRSLFDEDTSGIFSISKTSPGSVPQRNPGESIPAWRERTGKQ
jgi:hypothetical protein